MANYFQRLCGLMRKAIVQYDMLQDGDKVCIGVSGGKDSGSLRLKLLKKLDLPQHMSANAMLQALNLLYSLEDLVDIIETLESSHG